MAIAAIAAIEADRPQDAAQFLVRAEQALDGRHWSVALPLAWTARGMQDWHQCGAAAALPGLVRAAEQAMRMQAYPWALGPIVEAADAAAEAGDYETLVAMRDHLATVAHIMTGNGVSGLHAWANGRVALQAGDRDAAAAAAREAVSLLGRTEWQGQLARALHLLGRCGQDGGEAVGALERAAALYEATGAAWRRTRVLTDLRTLGSAGRRAAAGPASLSPREREVAGLAAGGMSARRIAERLVLSERTVETHLSRAYGKLGVESKLELVRRAAELGL